MATREDYFSGKCKYAQVHRPDQKYDCYSILLYPDEPSLEKIKKLKEGKPAIMNELKMDEDGTYIRFRRDLEIKTKMGKKQLPPPIVTNADGTMMVDTWIGNGSDVTVGCEIYTYRKGEGLACRLKSVRADNLIPYKPEMTPDPVLQKQYGEMGEQPTPKW